jgi:Mlc titration factor MtfA (ptsG expression regulator)
LVFSFFKSRRRKKLLAQPLSAEQQEIIASNVAVSKLLSTPQCARLIAATKIIATERTFVGSGGLVITDEIKFTISAQAALLLLGEDGYYFDRVPTLFVYPHYQTTKARRDLKTAILVEEGVAIEGQVLDQGEIRLAWDNVLYGSRDASDGENVVLHEFAHHLDGLDGEIGGIPPLASRDERQRWIATFDRELADLRRYLASGHEVFLHAEAAENRAELFAYSTECFFEQPRELAEFHPELFECLRGFYKIDPREWF